MMKQSALSKRRKPGSARRSKPAPPAPPPPAEHKPFPIVGVGASAGGLEAFTELLQGLPLDTGMAFVLVQHLHPERVSELTHILTRISAMPVSEVSNNLPVQPNHVYVIPPNASLSIVQGELQLRPRAPTGSLRAIDFFFKALAADQRERAIGIVLSGTASDGTLGLEAIKAQDGITFAQDDSAKYPSMPRSAIAAGCVDFVLSPAQMAEELARIAKHPYVRGALHAATEPPPGEREVPAPRPGAPRDKKAAPRAPAPEYGIQDILALVRHHAGVDFSQYKLNTIQRRITRRLVLNKLGSLGDYARLLGNNPKELDALYADLLINVTSFFRNPEAFAALKRLAFPRLLSGRRVDPLRVWVPGCSSGQEAYSLAMALTEYAEAQRPPIAVRLQIFASDLSERLLTKARSGLFPKALVQDLSPERLRRFFVEEEGGYRVIKSLREAIVFARQDVLADPPFSRLDLISCRNLMIYLEASPQQKLIPTFHYALKPDGFLFLGASESIGSFSDLFEPADRKHKIYSRKAGPHAGLYPVPGVRPVAAPLSPSARAPGRSASPAPPQAQPAALNPQREADRIALNRYAPPGVLIDADGQVLQFRGDTSPFLKPPTGKASFSVLNMAREGLRQPLRAALQQARRDKRPLRRENLRLDQNSHSRVIHLEVVPLNNLPEPCFVVFFEDAELLQKPTQATKGGRTATQASVSASASVETASTPGRAALERELAETRDYLQSLQEQYEAANEELQASNEEATSINEELQSINEELETSKEELESSNEELVTVNEEMAHRNTELGRLNSDLLNFQGAANMAVILLARDQTIRRFTAKGATLFNLTATDLGRSIHSMRHNLDLPGLQPLLDEVMDTLQECEREVRDHTGHWYSLRLYPYRTIENHIDGTVLVLVDIDVLKRSAQELLESREYTEAIVRSTRDMLVVLGADLRVHSANDVFYETFRIAPSQAEGRVVYELGNGQWNIPRLRELLEDILPRNTVFNGFEVDHQFESIGRRVMVLNARTLKGPRGQPERILLGIHDLTETARAQAQTRASEVRFRRLFEAARDGVLLLDPATHRILDANPFILELLGRTREELRGKTPCELGLFQTRQACEAFFEQLGPQGFLRTEDLPLVTKSGEQRQVEFISNLYQEDGAPVLQCSVRDITARKQAEEALRRSEESYRALAEHVPQLIWTCSPEGQCDYLNQQWCNYTGRSAASQLGKGWLEAVHPDDRDRTGDAWKAAVERQAAFQLEYRLKNAQGDYRWFEVRGVPLLDAQRKVRKWFGTCTDVEDQKRAKESLERAVAERTAALRETVHELEAFSYSLGHDLRAPLRSMKGYADLLAGAYGPRLEDRGRDFLQRISAAATRMDTLIQDVLSYTRVLRADTPLAPLNLDKMLREILDSYPEFQPPRADIQLEGTLPTLLAHPGFLTQALSNLLSNAIKFVAPGVTPGIRIWAEPAPPQPSSSPSLHPSTAFVRLWIADNGIGIGPEDQARIFQMFVRVGAPTEYEGTGIGLTIVRKAVERMGGRVGVESAPGQGSKFWIELRTV